jgi:GT2 family glycosyltransferase
MPWWRRLGSGIGRRTPRVRETARLVRRFMVDTRSLWARRAVGEDLGRLTSDLTLSYRPVRLAASPAVPHLNPVQLSVIVPVYGNPELFGALVADLVAALAASRRIARHEIIIVDDASDPTAAAAIEATARRESFLLLVNAENLGYLRSVNGAARRAQYDTLLILNTDVRFDADAIDCGLTVMSESEAVVVSLADHSTLVELGLRIDSWDAANRALRASPNWMLACTATGYFMFWRRSSRDEVPFDELLGHGYGEDTDLHYRTLVRGQRSVLALNACVLHEGARSYSLRADYSDLRQEAMERFRFRWGALHDRHWQAYIGNIRPHLEGLSVTPS